MQLIRAFVFANAKSRFSHDAAKISDIKKKILLHIHIYVSFMLHVGGKGL